MIRQDHNRVNGKWVRGARLLDRRAQRLDVVDQRSGGSIRQRDGEEIRSALNEITTVSDHASP